MVQIVPENESDKSKNLKFSVTNDLNLQTIPKLRQQPSIYSMASHRNQPLFHEDISKSRIDFADQEGSDESSRLNAETYETKEFEIHETDIELIMNDGNLPDFQGRELTLHEELL